ncbi:MAG: hypothetical protein ACD_63C00167G0005 [uncultured bacterium]|nr:MAG: hypothetical protein ACD_63C00167G0005 [uncultured bacterium]
MRRCRCDKFDSAAAGSNFEFLNSKMPYFRSKFYLIIVLLIIVFLFFILYGIGVLRPVVSFARTVFSPVQRGFVKTGNGVAGFFNFLGSIGEMDEKNTKLQQEVNNLRSENAKLKEMQHENEILRDEIGFQYEHNLDTVPAAIIGYNPDPGVRKIEINVGRDRGIENDMPVIISSGLLVGRVTEVFETTSNVLFIVDKRSVVNAVVQDSRATGIVKGEHGIGLIMESVPQNEDINKGNTIVTSGLGGIYPEGLVIGEVYELKKSSNALFKEARIKPAVDFDTLELVFVVVGTK